MSVVLSSSGGRAFVKKFGEQAIRVSGTQAGAFSEKPKTSPGREGQTKLSPWVTHFKATEQHYRLSNELLFGKEAAQQTVFRNVPFIGMT